MDKKILCFHIMNVMKEYNLVYEVDWIDKKMVWKKQKLEFYFSEKEVAMFEFGMTHNDRYLHYVLNHLTSSESTLLQLKNARTIIEAHNGETIPVEVSFSFPKMAYYSSSKKKILLNPLKLEQYSREIQTNLVLSQEEIVTYIFLHEYGHFLQDRDFNLSKKGKEQLERAKRKSENEFLLLEHLHAFIYETEKNAWERGADLLPLFPFSKTTYEAFSEKMLASYKYPSLLFLKERIRFYSP